MLELKKCPHCKIEMKITKGYFPWMEWYYICEKCKHSELFDGKDSPSFRGFSE